MGVNLTPPNRPVIKRTFKIYQAVTDRALILINSYLGKAENCRLKCVTLKKMKGRGQNDHFTKESTGNTYLHM